MSKEFLRRLPLFAELNEDDLDQLCEVAVPTEIKAGEILVEEGAPPDSLYVIVAGEFEVTKRSSDGKEDVVLSVRKSGELVGEISVLEQAPRMATLRAIGDAKVLTISQEAFYKVMSSSPSALKAILHVVMSRLRSTESLLVQNEKMAALGTLSAGLAHELNNPSAAIVRSADQLRERLSEWQTWSARLDALNFEPDQIKKLDALRAEMSDRAANPVDLDPLERSDQEEAIQTWLDDRNVEDSWEIAPMLVPFGWQVGDLNEICSRFSNEQVGTVTPWLAYGCSTYALLEEVGNGATRVSEIVKAVKNYSYLDQAPVQEVDLHKGIEDTLVILKHKLKDGITVKREYAPDLPRIEAYAGELNQVWTNLIDNAADAMQGKGELTIKTFAQDSSIVVEITDNGPGIPPDVLLRIFQPFYTTKPQGVGTGLGLHIAYNIVADKHRGKIEATSEPGKTTFTVTLPCQLARS